VNTRISNVRSSECKVYFTKKQIEQANRVSIEELANLHGFQMENSSRGKALHAKKSGGLYIFPNNNRFHCFTEDISGGAIDFIMHYENLSFTEAVARLLNTDAVIYEEKIQPYQPEEKGELILPEKEKDYKRAYWYLVSKRGIDPQIVSKLMNEHKIYQQKDNGNCVFVGFDKDGKSKYCAVRGTFDKEGKSFRMDVTNSDKAYPFVLEGKSDTVFVCEAPIDAMSHATLEKHHRLDWKADSRISLGCLSDNALQTYLTYHTDIRKIIFCLDNDYNAKLKDGSPAPNYGQEAAHKFYEKYEKLGYQVGIQTPQFKDFNQDLVETRKASNDLNIKLELIEDKKKKNREMVTESSKADCAFMEDGWEEVEEGFEP